MQQIRDSYWLATIALDVPITLDMNELKRKDLNEDALRKIYESLEFGFLLKKINANNVAAEAASKTKKSATNSAQLDLFSDFNPQDNVTVSADPIEEYVESEEEVVGHDLKSIFRKNGKAWPKKNCFDTMLAHYLLHPEMNHNLSAISQGEDLATLRQRLEQELKEQNLWELFQTVEMPLAPILLEMERVGARIDTEGLKETSLHYTERMNALEEEIHQLSGLPGFNIASPRQVGEVLFDRLHLSDKPKKTKTGQYVTSEDILESLRGSHPIVEKILQHRSLKKLLGTYIDALPLLINKDTGHIHTTFNQAVTATGRLSSSNPNLQNIPVRDAEGKEVRKAFIPDEGELFFSTDYSQIELRIMAHLSGDQNLIDAFLSGQDIHAATAAKIFHRKIEDVTADERRSAKTANFGIIYGISAFGLAQRIGCSRSEAKSLIDGYFLTYPQVREYMDESIRLCRERLYAETIFHRRCHLPDIMSGNAVVRGYAERNAINAPIQGSAADIIKMAMIRVARRMKKEGVKSHMILQVHDELNFSVPKDEKELMQRLVVEEMQAAATLRVPLIADAGWGSNWLEAH
jgi:DNA polymerase-1